MKFNITADKLIGTPSPAGWSECHDFTPVSEESLLNKGRLISIISVTSQNGYEIAINENLIAGKQILTRLHEEYYGKSGDNFELLTKAVNDISKEFTSENETLSAVAAILVDGKIFLSNSGNTQAWVVRKGQIARLLTKSPPNSSSGILERGDIFILGTDSFFEKTTPDLLKAGGETNLPNLIGDASAVVLKITLPDAEGVGHNLPNLASVQNIQPTLERPIVPPYVSPIRRHIADLIDKILVLLPEKKIFIKEEIGVVETSKRRKVATLAGLILLALLAVSIIFGVRQQKISSIKSKYQDTLTTAQHDLDEAQSINSINPSRARELVIDANNEIKGLQSQGVKDPQVDVLAGNIANAMGQIAGLYNENPTMYLDLAIISSGLKGDDIAASDQRMAVLDKTGKRLVSIDIGTKQTNVVAGPDIMPNATFVAVYSDRNFVSANDGIWEVLPDKASIIIPQDKDISNNVLISAYTGNFYVMDKTNSVVWRYIGNSGGFDLKQNWFGSGVKPDLSAVEAWTIDGNIWMLTKDGNILKFTGGSPIDFSLKGVDSNLQAVDIFTTQDSKYLYILDSGNSRILVVNKDDGSYKAQYTGDNIKNAKKIIVSEQDQKMILLEGDKLFTLDIKHL